MLWQSNSKLSVFTLGSLALGAGMIIFLAKGSFAEPKEDPRIVATLTISQGYNADDLCHHTQRVERLTLHADGRMMELSTHRGTICTADGEYAERGSVGVPRWSRISENQLSELLIRLRARKGEALKRMAQEPVYSSTERQLRERTESLSISVTNDRFGSVDTSSLPTVRDISDGSGHFGRQIRSEVRAAVGN